MFDRYVSGKRPSWKRRALLIGSLGLHAGLAVALLVASLFHVSEITPPPLSIVFLPVPPPEGSAAKKPEPQHRPKAKTVAAKPRQLLQPTEVPAKAPVIEPSRTEPGTTAPDTDTIGDGDGDGDGGGGQTGTGTGIGPGPGPTRPAAMLKPKNVPPYALDAQRIAGTPPHLPDFVKVTRRGLGDMAFLARVCVDQGGNVNHVEVMQGIPGADDQIVQTLRGWRYKPQPIPVCFLSRFLFNVQ